MQVTSTWRQSLAWTCAGKPEEQRGWFGTVARELIPTGSVEKEKEMVANGKRGKKMCSLYSFWIGRCEGLEMQ